MPFQDWFDWHAGPELAADRSFEIGRLVERERNKMVDEVGEEIGSSAAHQLPDLEGGEAAAGAELKKQGRRFESKERSGGERGSFPFEKRDVGIRIQLFDIA